MKEQLKSLDSDPEQLKLVKPTELDNVETEGSKEALRYAVAPMKNNNNTIIMILYNIMATFKVVHVIVTCRSIIVHSPSLSKPN